MKKVLQSGNKLLKQISLPTYYKLKYKRTMGYWPNLKKPQFLSEKIVWLNLYYYPKYDLAIELGDKNGLREKYKESPISVFLPPIIGIYNNVEAIDFESLPNQYVLKKSSGSNMNAIVLDKKNTDINELKKKVDSWMATDFGELTGEKHYSKMDSKIIIEELLDIQREYQIFCFNGVAKFASTVEFNMLKNENGDFIDYKEVSGKEILDVDKLLTDHPDIKEILSFLYEDIKNIPLVRVDIIETKDRIYLGELTFTPAGGMLPNYDDELQLSLGNYLVLPDKN